MPVRYQSALPASADVVIVGGGAVGAATAFAAARAGLRPLLLERRSALCALTTAAATGAFRLQFDNRDEWVLVRESVDLFLNFAEQTRQREYDPAVRQQGYLWLTTDAAMADVQRDLVAVQHGWGQTDVELLDGDAARRRFPFIGPAVIQARFRAGDGLIDQKALTLGLVAASGAAVLTNCVVTSFDIAGDRLTGVVTTHGTVATECAILAAGPFSAQLAGQAGIDLPLTNVRRQKTILPDLPEVPPDAPMTIDEDSGTHWRPALRGAYLLGAESEPVIDQPLEDVPTDSGLALRLLDPASPLAAARVAPFWADIWARGDAHWSLQAGHYVMTPDTRPLIGPSPLPGLWLNTGYGGHVVMASPGGSALLLDLITGRHPRDQNPFHPGRSFAGATGRAL
jgi:sarcosine oxidase, subunit beta